MGFLLLAPFLLLRFWLMARLDRNAVMRAAYFPPLLGWERVAYWIYQISNLAIFICFFFLRIAVAPSIPFYTGAVFYGAGLALLAAAVVGFAAPADGGFQQKGVYRLSRNPMYVAYFLFFLGCGLLTRSPLLLGFVLLFQITAHWIIRAEERWCKEQFGEAYLAYAKQVRRYF